MLQVMPKRPIPAVAGFDPARRGYHAIYREHETNHCPGCGRTHWYIGRLSAECGFCATAIPLAAGFGQTEPDPVILRRGKGGGNVN